MNRSRLFVLAAMLGCGAFPAGQAWAVLACSITASPATLSGAYDPASNLDMQGSFLVNCSRAKNDSKNQTLWIGLNQTVGQTLAKAPPYPDTIAYGIYTDVGRTTRWTEGVGGGFTVPLSFGNATAASATAQVYMRASSGQTDKAAGTYSDTLNVTLNSNDSLGQNLSGTTLTTEAAVSKSCVVDLAPLTYSVNYLAFRSTALVDSSQSVAVTCSKGTQVTLALDRVIGVILPVELKYTLTFSAMSQTAAGTSSSSSTAQIFGLTLTLPAGQAGACGTATCSGSDTRQITVTY